MTLRKELISIYRLAFQRHRLEIIVVSVLYLGLTTALVSYQRARDANHALESQIRQLEMRLSGVPDDPRRLLVFPAALQFKDNDLSNLPSTRRALVSALNEFGRYSIRAADYDQALSKFDESLRVAPTSEALYYKGLALYGKRAFPLAIQPWRQVFDMDLPPQTKKQVALNLALAYYQKDDPLLAKYYFQSSMEANPKPQD